MLHAAIRVIRGALPLGVAIAASDSPDWGKLSARVNATQSSCPSDFTTLQAQSAGILFAYIQRQAREAIVD